MVFAWRGAREYDGVQARGRQNGADIAAGNSRGLPESYRTRPDWGLGRAGQTRAGSSAGDGFGHRYQGKHKAGPAEEEVEHFQNSDSETPRLCARGLLLALRLSRPWRQNLCVTLIPVVHPIAAAK